jgi:vacuolar-type H+-ATPase subunit B/Vma2
MQEEYKTINEISGPLVYVEKTHDVAYGDIVEIEQRKEKSWKPARTS